MTLAPMLKLVKSHAVRRWGPLVVGGALAVIALTVSRCAPTRPAVESQERTVDATATATRTATAAVVRRVVQVETRADGGRVETTTDEREDTAATTTATAAAHVVVRELVVREVRASWRVTASTGWQLDALALRPGLLQVDVARRVAGPVWLGAWARTDKTAGVSLAFEW